MRKNARPKTAAEYAIDEIKRLIIEQQLSPGTHIDQTEIARMLEVSRIPVRQALANLAQRGFIRLQAHRTATVAPLSRTDVEDLYVLRERLEAWAIQESISRFQEADFLHLEHLNRSMEDAAARGDLVRYMVLNREFHFALFSKTRNPHLLRVLESFFDLTERYQWMYLNSKGSKNVSLGDHRELIDRLRRRDLKGVVSVAARHNKKTVDWVVKAAKTYESLQN